MGNARTYVAESSFRPGIAACALALFSGPLFFGLARAASLGDEDVRSFLGQPLDVRVAIRAAPDQLIDLSCIEARGGDDPQPLPRGNLRIDQTLTSRTLIVRTTTPIEHSGFKLDVRVNCGGETASRSYTLAIPAIPQIAYTTNAAPAAIEVSPTPTASSKSAAPAPALPPQLSGGTSLAIVWTSAAGETLRAIARGLYPASVALQDAYIEKMRSANPGLDQRPDQPLDGGVKITLPDLRVFANESPRYAEQQAVASPPAQTPRRERVAKEQPARAAAPPTVAAATPEPVLPPANSSIPPAPRVAAAPPSTPKKAAESGGSFVLRLSGAEMDLSRSRGVTETMRAGLRDKQLTLDADDQVAAFLALKNTVKELESRINEMQLTLSKATQLSTSPSPSPAKPVAAPPAPTASVAPAAALPVQPAPPVKPAAVVADPVPLPAPSPSVALPDKPAAKETTPATVAPVSRPETPPQAIKPQPETRPLRPAPKVEDEPWWNSIWVWAAAGLLAVAAIIMLLVRKRAANNAAASLQSGTTSGFSDWASEPAPEEDEASTIRDMVARRGNGAAAPMEDEDFESTITPPEASFEEPAARYAAPVQISSGAIPQLPQRIGGPDEDGTASLELDTRPGIHIDFPLLGDEGAEDRARRLHYMEERFPELANKSIGVDEPDSIIDAARHYFEDDKIQQSCELLTYAFEEHPGQLRFWLALFEIHRLERKVTEFNVLAMRFKNVHGGTDAWPKVQHIGRDLDPLNPLYSAALGQLGVPEDQEFDPIAENWLNVPMDFTSDALMAELRRGLLDEHGVEPAELKRLSVASYS